MEKDKHREITLDYFKKAAVEKRGFYDASHPEELGHSIWQRRVRSRIRQSVASLANTYESLVDIGCGNGDFVGECALKFPELTFTGHDFSAEMINEANAGYRDVGNLCFGVVDLLEGGPPAETFDIVLCLNMFHHVHLDDIDRAMEAIASMARHAVIFELKNEKSFLNRHLRPDSEFPFTLISVDRVVEFFDGRGFTKAKQWNIFFLESLSPIVVLEFRREGPLV